MEKIILVQPNTQSKEPGKFFLKRSLIPQFKIAPLGLLHIAGYLKKKKDYDVELIDANEKRWNENKVAKYILSKNPDFVGLSTNVSTIQKTKDIINILKKQNRDIKTIVGGSLPTTNPIETINYTNSDFVVSGDGEIPFYNIIINSKNIKKIKKLLGVTIKKKKKFIIINNLLSKT